MTDAAPRRDPWLLTPGPLTTSADREAGDAPRLGLARSEFIAINRRVREKLVALAGGDGHPCLRAHAGQRHLRRRGHDRQLRAGRAASC